MDFRDGKIPPHTAEGVSVSASPQGLKVVFPAGRVGRILFSVPPGKPNDGGVAVRFAKIDGPDNWSPLVLGQNDHPGLIEGAAWISQGEHFWLLWGAQAQPNQMGLGYNPPVEGPSQIAGSYQDHRRIDTFGMQISYPSRPVTIQFVRAYAAPKPNYSRLIDRWGQSNLRKWQGRITSDQDLKDRLAEEQARIAAEPRMPDIDQFGGWTRGPQLPATGRFRVAQYKGKWAFVTPTGRLFLSAGMNNITSDEGTVTQQREQMFDWLPEPGDPLAAYYGQAGLVLAGPAKEGWKSYDFARANAHRQFGPQWQTPFWELTEKRMWHWGFNTLANWTDRELSQRRKVPYVATVAVWGPSRALYGSPDPFDPRFEETLRDDLKNVAFAKNDPWCLGIFVDNEINWGSGATGPGRIHYFRAALDSGPEVWGKRRLLAWAQGRFASISALNQAWKTDYASWDDLMARKVALTDAQINDPKVYADGIEFSRLVYAQYFRVVRRVLNEMLPGTLYLGPRFHAWTPDAAEIAARYCDVVSFNSYSPELGPSWIPAPGWKAPTLIGEFGFRGRDTGFFNRTGTDALTQQDRANKMARFWKSAFARDWMIGVHWFRYRDQSVLGRMLDGENANFGFVAITNTVYPELERMARRLTSRMYEERWPGG
jgi:hypothetical protein